MMQLAIDTCHVAMISNHALGLVLYPRETLVKKGWNHFKMHPKELTMPLTSSFFPRDISDIPPKSYLDTKNGLKNDNNAFPFKHGVILGICCQIRGRARCCFDHVNLARHKPCSTPCPRAVSLLTVLLMWRAFP